MTKILNTVRGPDLWQPVIDLVKACEFKEGDDLRQLDGNYTEIDARIAFALIGKEAPIKGGDWHHLASWYGAKSWCGSIHWTAHLIRTHLPGTRFGIDYSPSLKPQPARGWVKSKTIDIVAAHDLEAFALLLAFLQVMQVKAQAK